jgi:hypothetical protein
VKEIAARTIAAAQKDLPRTCGGDKNIEPSRKPAASGI